MRIYKILLLIGVFLLFFLFSIESGIFSPDRVIAYSRIDNIEWNSFKRLPNLFDDYVAEIVTSIDYKIQGDTVFVESFMHPFKSSTTFPDLLPPIVLKHEKYHFKITELLSRRFESELNQLGKPLDKKEILDRLFIIEEKENLIQKTFDLDTKHGQDTLIQDAWFEIIDTLLRITDSKSVSTDLESDLKKPTLVYFFRTITTFDSIRLQLTYFDNGDIRSEVVYKNEKPDGYYFKWFEYGRLNQSILYNNGSREGFTVTYNLFGDTIETQFYRNNKITN